MKLFKKLDDWALKYVPGPLYRLPTNIKEFYYKLQYAFQLVFRKDHVPDRQVWNMYSYLVPYIYPRIKRFIESNRMGYPGIFSEYNENEWQCKEDYDEYIKNEKILGGGREAWDKILEEILFAFEFLKAEEDEKFKKKVFDKKHEDVHKKISSNLHNSNSYKNKKDGSIMIAGDNDKVDQAAGQAII